MPTDLASIFPITKFETDKAQALVDLGFPEVEPVMPQILEWLQDLNWPVGRVFHPFLVSIGRPLAPHIRKVLVGKDDCWKYSLLRVVVAQCLELALALRPELEMVARIPSHGESEEEVDQVAKEILEALDARASEA